MKLAPGSRFAMKSAATVARPITPEARAKSRAFVFEVKASDDAARTLTGLAAAWSLDQGGDIIRKGAFARTLDHWRGAKKTRPIPLKDLHRWQSVEDVIGRMTEAEETDDGLLATFEFIPDDPKADAVYRRVKGGYVTGLSIGYMAKEWSYITPEGAKEWDRVRVLTEVQLLEVSVVDDPMNDDARIDDVKSLDALARALRDGTLTDEQKSRLRALLDAPPAGTSPDEATPPAPDAKGLAPDDPRRIAAEALLRDVTLRSLATAL
jgi:HK97 family phage prohead protease